MLVGNLLTAFIAQESPPQLTLDSRLKGVIEHVIKEMPRPLAVVPFGFSLVVDP